MGDFVKTKSFLFAYSAQSRAMPEKRSYFQAELASILQCKPATVKGIIADLQKRDLLALSPAKQIAQIAIASRCGSRITRGDCFLVALSVPMVPAKLQGSNELFRGKTIHRQAFRLLDSYEGFKTPLSSLEELPREHSFVDMFEKLLLGAKRNRGHRSMLEDQGIELGSAVIFDHAAQVTFDYGQAYRELVQYALPGEMAVTCEDSAQFTKHTIFRLANLVWEPVL